VGILLNVMDKEDNQKMAPNVDELKVPEMSEFNEDDEDIDFEGVHSDIDNINSALDQMEQRADSILAAILNLAQENKQLVKEIQEEKVETVQADMQNTHIDDTPKKD